jgi:predicted lipoprotein
MKKSTLKSCLVLFGLGLIMFSSCRKKGCIDAEASNYSADSKKDDGSCIYEEDDFISSLLTNVGSEIIIPRYQVLDSISQELDATIKIFAADISIENLIDAKEKLKQTELAWQKCSTFELGPAEIISLRTHVNTFPTDITSLEDKIVQGSYDLSSFLAAGYKGLPALDYLLNNDVSDSIVKNFQNSTNRLIFLEDLSSSLKSDISTVYQGWLPSGENYLQEFIESNGSDVSSSLSLLVNQFNYDFELTKNAKVGIPLGKATLGTPMIEQGEAYFGGVSSELAQESLKGLYNLYLGVSESGIDADGFHDYLIDLNNESLSQEIDAQFQEVIGSMENVPDPMAETIQTNQSVVDMAYEEIKKLVVLIKTDMSTEMEVSITYSDGDGD